jgi:hypothetical protein
MPEALAEGGVICINYPEGVLLPGELKPDGGDKKSKGINDLGNREIGVLLKSFDDGRLPIQFLPDHERKGGQYVKARDAATDKEFQPYCSPRNLSSSEFHPLQTQTRSAGADSSWTTESTGKVQKD